MENKEQEKMCAQSRKVRIRMEKQIEWWWKDKSETKQKKNCLWNKWLIVA